MPDADPKLMTLFAEALERTDPVERAAYLEQACGSNAVLRREVESLLAALAGAGRFLEPAATGADEPAPSTSSETIEDSPSATPRPAERATGVYRPAGLTSMFAAVPTADRLAGTDTGRVIAGRYTLLDVLGEGGMGMVYRADQTAPVRRQVALKLIKVGMDSRLVLARFDAERQALALMDHPNIARVYDGGTTEAGQPFFAMELVNGEPVTKYCDRKRLPVRARLELFVAVCRAVQHAHQKGIIHRDLKPGNVLVAEVDGRPTPKVIDFGVAKATEFKLTDQTFGDTGAIVGTPTYMSPEQADPSSMDIDTRTDIYALGVLLYELLAGSPPIDARQFRLAGLLEMLRMVREVDPPKPSTRVGSSDALPDIAASRAIDPAQLKRELRGDLDWIVMKALEKDRTRRYDTANGFAADILHHLACEPVQAAPPSRAYRARKFVRKNRGAVIAASLVLLFLLAGIAGTTWGLIRADRALKAEARRVTERDDALKKEADRVKERDAVIRVADARADELKHRLGVSEMVLAGNAYDDSNVVLAAERLANVPPEQRGWEWHYLKQQTRGGLFTLYGHTSLVSSASFSPDGSRIVTGAWDGTAKVWDTRTGILLLDLKGHTDGQSSASFSPDGSRIVTAGSFDPTAKVWDARTGAALLELKGHTSGVSGASFSPDSSRILTGSDDRTAKIWDARTGAALLELKGHTDGLWSVSFSPDGSRIVTGSKDKTAKVWDARTGMVLRELKAHKSWVTTASFSPDGSSILTGSYDRTAKVWDAGTGTLRLELKFQKSVVVSASFSPDGSRIATGGGAYDNSGEARVWDARTGSVLVDLKGHRLMVSSVSFSPDGTRIVTGGWDWTAKVWDARTGSAVIDLEDQAAGSWGESFSPDGSRILASFGQTAKVWDARTGSALIEVQGHTAEVIAASFSPDGSRILTGSEDKTAKVWDARTGALLYDLKGHTDGVVIAIFSPDGSRILTSSARTAKVWDARTGKPLLDLDSHTYEIANASFSPDGTRIVTGSSYYTAKVWDSRTGKHMVDLKGYPGAGRNLSFSHDGTRILTYSDRTANVWDSRTGALLFDLKHASFISSVAFSPDGSRIATGGGAYDNSGVARVWDARTGTALVDLKGHTAFVASVSFSPDGSRILTSSHDHMARIWDARTGTTLLELKGNASRVSLASFSPDGLRIVTRSEDGTAQVWEARTGTVPIVLRWPTGRVSSVSFSPDGSRVVIGGHDKMAKVWDARTGRSLEGEPIPPVISPSPISPDGRWLAHVASAGVELVPLQPDVEELEYRRIHTRPNPLRYREGYKEAKKANDSFAARFYLNLIPPSEREELETSELDRTFPADPFDR